MVAAVIGIGIESDASQTDPVEASDDVADIRAEGEAVSVEDPLDGDDAKGDKALHDRSQDILSSDHAAVEKGESGGHQHDERRRRTRPTTYRPASTFGGGEAV